MSAQKSLQLLLQEELAHLKSVNPQFSLRSFAKRLQLNPAALSQILNGKRNVSEKLAQIILNQLAPAPEKAAQVLNQFKEQSLLQKLNFQESHKEQLQLDMDQYQVVAEWQYYAILCLAETEDFQSDPQWIAQRLGLSVNKVNLAIERLLRLELLYQDENDKLMVKPISLRTTEDIANSSLKRRHEDNLNSAKNALWEIAPEDREISFRTMAINPDKLPEAKLLIREFKEKISNFLEEGAQQEVYEFSVQLFPRTQLNKNRGEND